MADLFFIDPCRQGSPVILLHGLGADAGMWQMQMDALAFAGLRPLALDVPGFGRSVLREPVWRVHTVVQQMSEWAGQMVGVPFALVGISMGGVLAQEWALDFPEQVQCLVLVNTFARLRPRSLGVWWYFLRRGVLAMILGPQAQAEMVARRVFPHPNQDELRRQVVEKILAVDRTVYRQAMRELILFNSLPRLCQLKMPVFVMSGLADRTVPTELQGQLLQGVMNVRHVKIAGAGHGMPVDLADAFNHELVDFLHSV